jgi:electron transfer flavoprotein beta subunit
MNIVVCMKQILDPEIPARDFRIDATRKEAVRGSANLVTNIFCENALEMALQLRDRAGGRITVVTFGAATAEEVLRKALAVKADAAVLVLNQGHPHPDPFSVAAVLAASVRKIGAFDLVLAGRESGDWGSGQTGALLAETLGCPCIAFVDEIEASSEVVRVRRQTDFGFESIAAQLPAVLTITNNERNVPRIPKTRDVMASHRQPITRWTLAELGVAAPQLPAGAPYYEVAELFIESRESRCQFVTGDTAEQKARAFAEQLAQAARSC